MAVYRNRARETAERLVKLRDYLYTNATPTHAVKIADMLTYLANEGHEVEIKTIYSDLKTLEVHFGLDIHYNGQQRGYLLMNPPFESYELRSIVNSIQTFQFITQEEADRLTTKVMKLADSHTSKSLNRKTFMKSRIRNINEDMMRGLDTVYEAIADDRKISFRYFDYVFDRNNPKSYFTLGGSKTFIVDPYNVYWDIDRYEVYGIGMEGGKERGMFFQLRHMEKVKILADKRDEKYKFRYMGRDDLFEKNGMPVTFTEIKLKVNKAHISGLIDKFGDKIEVRPFDSDSFVTTVYDHLGPDFYLWTLTFDPRIEIISPSEAETVIRKYFFEISQGHDATMPLYGIIGAF